MKRQSVFAVLGVAVAFGLFAQSVRSQVETGSRPQKPSAEYRPVDQPQSGSAGIFVAHEWGTFTSFQAGDGTLLSWKPLQTSQLPKFVYNWQRPGLGRVAISPLAGGKGSLSSLQRMETPVIYFYANGQRTVDVTVKFPEGSITEWYPQAGQIGPATASAQTDAPPGTPNPASPQSMIRWPRIRISADSAEDIAALATDSSGSHYFTARETDANTLYIAPMSKTGRGPEEAEKFLFYRGVANFTTPLRVVMKSDDAVNLANIGNDSMSHLFVLAIKDGVGRYVDVPELKAGEVKSVVISAEKSFPVAELSDRLTGEMSAALARTKLYPREAAAMANTWKDSWFREPGVRVLYALPRAWTDQTLPLTMDPAPLELVRTMVGRAEVLPPGVEADLVALLDKAKQGDQPASDRARAMFKDLGRFSAPAFNRVIAKIDAQPTEITTLASLLPIEPSSN